MLAGIDAGVAVAARRVDIDRGADGGQILRIALERQALLDQLLAEIARLERIVPMVGRARHLIEEADIVVAAGEQPEIVTMAVMFLAEHAGEARALGCQLLEIGRVEAVAE